MEKERKTQSEEATVTCSKLVLISSSSSGGTDSECNKATTSVVREANLPKRQIAAKNVATPQLAMARDREKVTDRSDTCDLIETVRSIGQDPKEFNINRTSIQRSRNFHYKSLAGSLKAKFQANCPLG